MTALFDQFTRWRCLKCGLAGIDSWNKAMFDGIDHGNAQLPDPWILGTQCDRCVWPYVISYTGPDAPPHAVYGPVLNGASCFSYEQDAMRRILADPGFGVELEPSHSRDADWSAGCIVARGQLQ